MKRLMPLDRSLLQPIIVENTYIALKGLVDNSWYGQTLMRRSDFHNGTASFLNEFCTVRMCTARQSGHTSSIVKLMEEYFSSAIYLTPNRQMSERASSKMAQDHVGELEKFTKREAHFKDGSLYIFDSVSSKQQDYMRYSFDAVIIDGDSMIKPADRQRIINDLCSRSIREQDSFFFILIQ